MKFLLGITKAVILACAFICLSSIISVYAIEDSDVINFENIQKKLLNILMI